MGIRDLTSMAPSSPPASSTEPKTASNQNATAQQVKYFKTYLAIQHTGIELLRKTLVDVCSSSPEFTDAVAQRLLVSKRAIEETNADAESTGPETKRQKHDDDDDLTSRYETCQECEERFDVTKNEEGSCEYHAGELITLDEHEGGVCWGEDPDPSYIPPSVGEPIDPNAEEVTDHYEAFRWNCCGQDGYGEPCVVTKHSLPNRT